MRKIVAGFASSVDGYIEGPSGEYDWILIDKEIDFTEYMKRFDTFFLGRKTYIKVSAQSSKSTPGITSYVFSNTLHAVDPGYQLIKGDIREKVLQIKREPGKDIAIFGGAGLLASLLDLQLVDELTISIIPVLLGTGKPMVEPLQGKVWLDYVSNKCYSNGTLMTTYSVRYNTSK